MYTIGLLYILYALNKTQLEPEDCPFKNIFPNHFLLVCVRFKGAERYQSLVDGSIGSNVEILWEPGANNRYSFVVSTYSILSQNITLYNGHKIFQTSFCGGFWLVLRWVFYITLPAPAQVDLDSLHGRPLFRCHLLPWPYCYSNTL